MRIVIFPIMCHLPRGDKKNSLLNEIKSKEYKTMLTDYPLCIARKVGPKTVKLAE